MLKLKDMYGLDSTVVPLSQGVLNYHWFPEVQELEWKLNCEVEALLEKDGRIEVRQLVHVQVDGSRYLCMQTVWFDGKPVMITQDAGRSGDDHHRRWITDRNTFMSMCQHLRSFLATDEEQADVFDPEALVYEEAMFCFYSHDFSKQFGYEVEPTTEGYDAFDEAHHIFPGLDRDLVMVHARAGLEMPTYIRRYEHVMKLEREVTEDDLQRNPRVKEICENDGYPQIYLYRHCTRPSDAPVVAI